MGFNTNKSKVSELSDVNINNPTNNQVLAYDTAAAKWKNVSSASDTGTWAPAAGPVPAAYAASNDSRFVAPPSSRQTGNFTLALNDAGSVIDAESATALTVTVPPSSSVNFAGNTIIEVAQTGAGQVTVTPGTGVTLRNPAGLKTRAQWSSLSLRKRPISGTSNGVLPTTGLLMRYRADDITGTNGSAVTSWPESSGNGLPAATQATAANQPILSTNVANGHSAVTFNGTSNFLQLTGTALNVFRNRSAVNVFIIYNYAFSVTTGARNMLAFSTGTSTTASRILIQARDTTTGNIVVGGRRADTDSGAYLNAGTLVAPENGIISARYIYSTANAFSYKNGTQLNSTSAFQTAGSTSDTASLSAAIGSDTVGAAGYFSGRIMEILVYNGDDANTRTNVHAYAQLTYGITMSDITGAGDEWIVTGDATA